MIQRINFSVIYPSVSLPASGVSKMNLNPEVQFGTGSNFYLIGADLNLQISSNNGVKLISTQFRETNSDGQFITPSQAQLFKFSTAEMPYNQAIFTNAINKLPAPLKWGGGINVGNVYIESYVAEVVDVRMEVSLYVEYFKEDNF